MGQLKSIPISQIRENMVALRTVNRDSEDYKGLVESIRNKGFLGAITVREREEKDPVTGSGTGVSYYELVDGLHRFMASKDAGIEEINVDVVNLNDDEVLEAQFMANIHKIETRPVEYSQQLRRILIRNPLMTEAQLAQKLGKSPQYIGERLNLNKIDNPTIKQLIDEGKINLSNAYALAKLPPREMPDWIDRAQTLPPNEFIPQVSARTKEIREANRQGRDAKPAEFTPVAYLQKLSEIKTELETGRIGAELLQGVNDPKAAWNLAIQWTLHLDPKSVAAAKAKAEETKREREEAKARKAAERDAKKKKEAAEKSAEASAHVDMLTV